jgi:hypothetical protein
VRKNEISLFQPGVTDRATRKRLAHTFSRRDTPRSRGILVELAAHEVVHQFRIRFPAHGFDDLPYEKSIRLFFPSAILFHGIAVRGEDLADSSLNAPSSSMRPSPSASTID